MIRRASSAKSSLTCLVHSTVVATPITAASVVDAADALDFVERLLELHAGRRAKASVQSAARRNSHVEFIGLLPTSGTRTDCFALA
jgi:hypothetical protein